MLTPMIQDYYWGLVDMERGSVQDIVFVTPSPDLNSYSTASLRPQPSLGNSIEEENIPDQHTHLPAYELSKVLSVDANYPANLVRWGGGNFMAVKKVESTMSCAHRG
ncbi:hypothetical protein TMatcc_001950 [Talaromyces marneffei ATCC 18224]